jgi:hypothetical protein
VKEGLCILAGLLVLMQACIPFAAGQPQTPRPPQTENRSTVTAAPAAFLDSITKEDMQYYITALQDLGTRYDYTEKLGTAADMIFNWLAGMGYTPVRQRYTYNGFELSNIYAFHKGTNASAPVYVLGAHYDSINGLESYFNPYAPAPGADDDASGVAAVLCCAKAFSRTITEHTVMFAAFSSEELSRTGSMEFAAMLKLNGTDVGGALLFDMIGYNHRYAKVDLVSNIESVQLSYDIENASAANRLGMIIEKVITNSTPDNWSDHVSFWEQGYPAMYFIEDENPTANSTYFEANPYYHTANDTVDKLNLTLAAKVAKLGAAAVAWLANVSMPDFRPEMMNGPGQVLDGDNVTFNISVFNSGASVGNISVSLSVDGNGTMNSTVVPDGMHRALLNWTASTGTHNISIRADANDSWFEPNENDNYLNFTLNVLERPDLQLSEFHVNDADPNAGDRIYFVMTIENLGGAKARCKLLVEEPGSDIPLLEKNVTLRAGQRLMEIANTTCPANETTYRAMLKDISPYESNDTNNEMNLTVQPHRIAGGPFVLRAVPDAVYTLDFFRIIVEEGASNPNLRYNYDFGDGTTMGWTASNATVYSYTVPGVYWISVRIWDDRGLELTLAQYPIVVRNRHPVPIIYVSPTDFIVNRTVTFSSIDSFDYDGEILKYDWEFGDGGKAIGSVVDHVFITARDYLVRLTVTDNYGASEIVTKNIFINNHHPVIDLKVSSQLVFAGEKVVFDATGSTDEDGWITQYAWDYEDGSRMSWGALANHTFQAPGLYNVTLDILDNSGGGGQTTVHILVVEHGKAPPPLPEKKNGYVVPATVIILLGLSGLLLGLGMRSHPKNAKEDE